MEDSEIKIEEKAGEEKTPAVSIEMVRHNGKDTLTKRMRGEGGKFVKQPKTMPKSLDVTRLLRNLLNQPVADENGKMTKGGLTRLRKMFDNIYQIAKSGKTPLGHLAIFIGHRLIKQITQQPSYIKRLRHRLRLLYKFAAFTAHTLGESIFAIMPDHLDRNSGGLFFPRFLLDLYF